MENQTNNGGWCKAALALGIISMVFGLLPLLSAWLMILTTLNYVLAPAGIICGIVALVKSQNMAKSIIGLVLCVLAFCAPFLLAEFYVASAADSVGNILDFMDDF